MQDVVRLNSISDLFTKGVHNNYLSVFVLTQNLYQQGKFSRTISLNASYIICFNNPRDKEQLIYLGRQMLGSKDSAKVFQEIVKDCFENKPHGYILLDFKQKTPHILRIRTNILPEEYPSIAYKVK